MSKNMRRQEASDFDICVRCGCPRSCHAPRVNERWQWTQAHCQLCSDCEGFKEAGLRPEWAAPYPVGRSFT